MKSAKVSDAKYLRCPRKCAVPNDCYIGESVPCQILVKYDASMARSRLYRCVYDFTETNVSNESYLYLEKRDRRNTS